MEDHGRKQEIANSLDDLNAALEEFSSEVAAGEMKKELAAALNRLRAALARRQCELYDLPDGSKKMLLTQAEEFEDAADVLEQGRGAGGADAAERRLPEEAGDDGQSHDDPGVDETAQEELFSTLKSHAGMLQELQADRDRLVEKNASMLELIKKLAACMDRMEEELRGPGVARHERRPSAEEAGGGAQGYGGPSVDETAQEDASSTPKGPAGMIRELHEDRDRLAEKNASMLELLKELAVYIDKIDQTD